MLGDPFSVLCSNAFFTFPLPLSSHACRDPGAVLKALASTVDEVRASSSIPANGLDPLPLHLYHCLCLLQLPHPLILGRSPSDPLAPRDRREQMEFIMAMEAGSKAADYFIRRWPEMFRGRQTEPVRHLVALVCNMGCFCVVLWCWSF